MPIIVSEIKISPDDSKELAFEKAFKVLRLKASQVKEASISKISVDARHNDRVLLVCSVAVTCDQQNRKMLCSEKLHRQRFLCSKKFREQSQ